MRKTSMGKARSFPSPTAAASPRNCSSRLAALSRRGSLALAALGLALGASLPAIADFVPITLTPESYNQDIVVEKNGPAPLIPGGYTTASMDGGTNNNGDTWNEVGYFIDAPEVGIPAAGSTFTSLADANHSYILAPDYKANNAIMLDESAVFASATFTLNTPAAFGALSFLTSGGNGGCIIRYTVHHQDGTTETGTTPSADWFNGANPAWIANGRVNAQTFTLDNYNSNNPRLYSKDVTLTNTSSPITSIDLAYVSSAAGAHTCVMAVSGAASATGAFSPIQVTGYNADIVVEASAPKAQALIGATTATMDDGMANSGATWYEQGYNPKAPATGLPAAGSTLTSTNAADHRYVLAPSYTANNAIVLDSAVPTVVITPTTQTAYSGLSFLLAAARGNVTIAYEVAHEDGSIQTGTITAPDWHSNTPAAYTSNGRVNLNNSLLESVNSGFPRLHSADIALENSTSPVSSITLNWSAGGVDSRAGILAVSGGTGAVAPAFDVQPAAVKISPGENATFTANAAGTAPITYQWQHNVNGTFVDVVNGGNVSGANTATLSITGTTEAQTGDYRVIATNAGGSATSSVAALTVLSSLPSITTPTDSITSFGGTSPAGEPAANAIDQTTSKHLNFAAGTSPFRGPVGFVVTPSLGRTIVKAIRFYTANDAPERDPADYTIEGSNDGGATWTAISSGSLALPDVRNEAALPLDPVTQAIQQVIINNNAAYTTYRVSFNTVKQNATTTMTQIGEVELLGNVDNSGAPFFATQPQPASAFAGTSAQFTVAANGNPTPGLRWYRNANGTVTALTDAGNVSGSSSATLTLNNVSASDAVNYFAVASNAAGSITSSVVNLTVFSSLTDVTTPSDTVTAIGDEAGAFWVDAANPALAIDNTTTKYVNGGSGFSAAAGFPPFNGPVGIQVAPAVGSTIVSGIRVYTADANPERDPIDYKLEGSNDGTTFNTIASGALALPDRRNDSAAALPTDPLTQGVQEVLFPNSVAYTTYRLTFTNTRNNSTANSLQVAEVELLGAAGTSGPSLSIARDANGVTITSSAPGTLQSTTALGGAWTSEGPINGSVTVPATGSAKFFRVVAQ